MNEKMRRKVRSSEEGDPRVFPPKKIESKRERHILNELKMVSLLLCLILGIAVWVAGPWQRGFTFERQDKVFVELRKLFTPKSPPESPPKKTDPPISERKPIRKRKEVEVGRKSRRNDVPPRIQRSALGERSPEIGVDITHPREDYVGRPSDRVRTIEPKPAEQTYRREERITESDVGRNLPPAYHQRIADRMLTLEGLSRDYRCEDFSYSYNRQEVTVTYGGRTYRLSALTVLPLPDEGTLRGLLDFFIRAFDERFR
ncbi:MAG: hypothetical protein KAW16_07450 [candidate division Zixibacteria bacterium]|nr:hypothetical protein [candidate division Zixibacteria bacterium]